MSNFSIDILSPDRLGKVTASRCDVLFPARDAKKGIDNLAWELANEYLFGYTDTVSTWQTEHGLNNEYHAEKHYEQYYGGFGSRPDPIIDHANQIAGSPDYLDITHNCGCDWKCPTSYANWSEWMRPGFELSKNYYYQAQFYMFITGATLWKVCAYLTETLKMVDNGLVYPITEEKRMIVIPVEPDKVFFDSLIERVRPVIEKRNEYIEVITNRLKL